MNPTSRLRFCRPVSLVWMLRGTPDMILREATGTTENGAMSSLSGGAPMAKWRFAASNSTLFLHLWCTRSEAVSC